MRSNPFKQLRFFQFTAASLPALSAAESALAASTFQKCAATQKKSVGWVPPRGNKHDPLLESVDGQWILRMQVETKSVPGAALREAVEERCKKIELAEGRKPGRTEKKDIKIEVEMELLPRVISKVGATMAWIDRAKGLIVVGSTSQSTCDDMISLIVENLTGVMPQLTIMPVDTMQSPQAAMANWLMTKTAPRDFSVDRSCELKAADESKAVVRYARHSLEIDEVVEHVKHGKLPVNLAMTFDEKVSFVLDDKLGLKKVELLDSGEEAADDTDVDHFNATISLATGLLGEALPALVKALGGYSNESAH